MTDDYEVLFRQIELEWLKYGVAQQVSAELLLNTELTVHRDYLYDSLLFRLTKHLLVDTFAEDTYTANLMVPANWWEHWKEQHGRKWLGPLIMRRWPVRTSARTAVIEVKRCLAYPEAKLARDPEGFGRVRILERTNGPYWKGEPR